MKTKDSKEYIKQDSQRKCHELKEKLERAFEYLTTNDDAAGEL